MDRRKRKIAGTSFVEVLLALGISCMAASGVLAMLAAADYQFAKSRTQSRASHSEKTIFEADQPRTHVRPRRARRTKTGLKFVRPKRQARRQSDAKQRRHRNQTASPCDGIHQTSRDPRDEQ
jgi:Tfp pilus assembly protein PilV